MSAKLNDRKKRTANTNTGTSRTTHKTAAYRSGAVKKKRVQKKTQSRSSHPKKENPSLSRRRQEVRRSKILLACGAIIAAVLLFLIFALPHLTKTNLLTDKGSLVGVNSDVLKYKDTVEAYCDKYDISEYSTLMLAIMQQESSGQGTDVFQCSESPFNTEYSSDPNSITDTDYSIRVGVETFAYCLEQAGCKSIKDLGKVKIALQEYNFGNNYAGWVLENYGEYSIESAYEFAEKMKAELGWSSYGDPEYVSHVLQYYEP